MSGPHGPSSYGPYGQQPPYGQPPYGPGEALLDQPLYGATIGQAVQRYLKKYATFKGSASRSEFWWWILVYSLIAFVLSIVNQFLAGPQPTPPTSPDQEALTLYIVQTFSWIGRASIAGSIWFLVNLIGLIALSGRRLHDTNRSAWFTLLYLIPLVGQIILIVFWASAPVRDGRRFDF